MSTDPSPDPIISLLGIPLYPSANLTAGRQRAVAQLAAAQAAFERDPSLEHTIWYGRRAAYCLQFNRALEIFSAGIARFPDAYALYRHRGHRLISTRRFAAARADLAHAAALAADQPVELEPDGIPNRLNRPLSTGHFNVWYHLGLACYLLGDYAAARDAYRTCLQYADNDDGLTATTDWLYMTERRLGDHTAAALLEPIHHAMDLIEDDSYHRRLLMYKGMLTPQALLQPPGDADPDAAELTLVTQGYGVANWYLDQSNTVAALTIFARMLQTSSWAAFGYIAAEADVARLGAASGILLGMESQTSPGM
jgi:tetratricopeptide (TPR) repeat protein